MNLIDDLGLEDNYPLKIQINKIIFSTINHTKLSEEKKLDLLDFSLNLFNSIYNYQREDNVIYIPPFYSSMFELALASIIYGSYYLLLEIEESLTQEFKKIFVSISKVQLSPNVILRNIKYKSYISLSTRFAKFQLDQAILFRAIRIYIYLKFKESEITEELAVNFIKAIFNLGPVEVTHEQLSHTLYNLNISDTRKKVFEL